MKKPWKHPCENCGKIIVDSRTRRCMECWKKIKHAPIKERFFRLVRKDSECWIWIGGKSGSGYGVYHELGQSGAHRVSWIIHNGPIPKGLLILHQCDNPPCVNPKHLRLGTQSENIQEAIKRGRWHSGEKHPMARVNEETVRAIRASGLSRKQIQERFRLSKSNVQQIMGMVTWKHVI